MKKIFIFLLSVLFLYASVSLAAQVRSGRGGAAAKNRPVRILRAPTSYIPPSTGAFSGTGSLFNPSNVPSLYGRYGDFFSSPTTTTPTSQNPPASAVFSNPAASAYGPTGSSYGPAVSNIPVSGSPNQAGTSSSSTSPTFFGLPSEEAAMSPPEGAIGSTGSTGFYSVGSDSTSTTSYSFSSIRSKRFFVIPATTLTTSGQYGSPSGSSMVVNPFAPNPLTVNPFAQGSFRINPFASNWVNQYNNPSLAYPSNGSLPEAASAFNGY